MNVTGVSDYDYTFSYDQMGRFEKIIPTGGSTAFQYYYDAASNEIQRSTILSGGVTVDKLTPRDSLNRITRRDLQKNGTLFATEAYTYDPMNRLTDESYGSVSNHYGYYSDGEMDLAQYDLVNGTAARTVNYTLDKAGNRTTVLDNVYGNASYTPNPINQYTAVTGTSITNGSEHEISGLNNITYTYINDERLKSAFDGTTTYSMVYDALGRCMERMLSNGPTTYYVYDGEKPILEYDSNGSLIARNVYGKAVDEILMRKETTINGGGWFYYEDNHEGSITHLLDASGNKVEVYEYDAFGAITTMADGNGTHLNHTNYDNRFLFSGREYAATYRSIYTSTFNNAPSFNFYEYRARAYNPTLGRFMSEDSKLFDAGDYNLFRYCHNDPEDLTDPMGLADQELIPGPNHANSQIAADDRAYNFIMGLMQREFNSAISAGIAGFSAYQAWSASQASQEMASQVHDPVINGKNYDASRNYATLGRATGVKAEEMLMDNPGAGEFLSYIGKKQGDFIASQPEPQHAGALVNYSEVYNKRADPSAKNDPLRGTGYRTVAAVVAQKQYTPAGISGHDLSAFRRAGLDGWVAVPSPLGRPSIGISVRFHDEHNVYGTDGY